MGAERPSTPVDQDTEANSLGSPLRFHDKLEGNETPPAPPAAVMVTVPARKPVPSYEKPPMSPSLTPGMGKPLPTPWESPQQEGPPTPPIHVNNTPIFGPPAPPPHGPLPPAPHQAKGSSFLILDNKSTPPPQPPAHQSIPIAAENLPEGRDPSPPTHNVAYRERPRINTNADVPQPQSGIISNPDPPRASPKGSPLSNGAPNPPRSSSFGRFIDQGGRPPISPHDQGARPAMSPPLPQLPLQYHHQEPAESTGTQPPDLREPRAVAPTSRSDSPASSAAGENAIPPRRLLTPANNPYGRQSIIRPSSAYSTLSLPDAGKGRSSPSNNPGSPGYRRVASGHSPDSRRASYIDLLNVPYPQPPPTTGPFNNSHLRTAVGSNASLLSHKQTLEMYRANAKKTNDPAIQYEFAVFMIGAAQELGTAGAGPGTVDGGGDRSPKLGRDLDSPYVDNSTASGSQAELLREARQILQRLSDRSYPFAQYYLADGYASGLFNKGKPDWDKAFPLFVSAGKHGHAEASYRAALCYEFGWGCWKDPAKAVQFYRQSASKNHPGAMLRLGKACLTGDLGLGNRYREGLKWLKRGTDSADFQYNAAPYELGLLHERGFGDDVFQDETYAAQLFTQAADLGHAEASYRMGDSYEHGKLSCPRDPALSVHFYNGAAQQGHPAAMMALCAWYMVGAEPVLDKDENEAYEWARKAAEAGLAKAQYAVGYFTEMGIGCRRDPLEANVWYVKAADQGDERATNRLAVIRAAASGDVLLPSSVTQGSKEKSKKLISNHTTGGNDVKHGKDDKDCVIM
ncbi:MAG: hypothetical protein M1838_002548 [Thelocarpon superellum]|nr:MAG: hypothetical protein M1838_002548 [Thelocarpon superellum]